MEEGNIYLLYAGLLSYPDDGIRRRAMEIQSLLRNKSEKSSTYMEKFIELLECHTREKLEEIYTSTFDLHPICYPYAGYHLFGDDYRRSQFMTRLKEEYRKKGFFPPDDELPDHIGIILKYMGTVKDDETILNECLLPVIEKMTSLFNPLFNNPYFYLMTSLLLFLREKMGIERKEISFTDGGCNHE